jgi:peptide/nickel transport system ATP-binding protein
MNGPLVTVEGLNVAFPGRGGTTHAVRDVSFTLGRERMGIVGESGSGKSTVGRAVLGLLPSSAQVSAKRMDFAGESLLNFTDSDWQRLRGRRASMVMQDPKFSLNPVMKVGRQIGETCRLHLGSTARDAERRTLAMLEAVKIRDPDMVYHLYPHQLSGGMGQRVMIAMMLIAEPDVLIADEPTSALDVTVQNEVLRILDDLVRDRGMGLIFISHNLTVVSSFCDRVLIMYGGRIMEECEARNLHKAKHPYTRALLAAAPSLDDPKAELATMTRDPEWLA